MKACNAYKLTKRPQHIDRLRSRNTASITSIFFICSLSWFSTFAEEFDDDTANADNTPLVEQSVDDFNLVMTGIVDKTDQAILETLTAAAAGGSAKAALALGNRYFKGTGVEKNTESAIKWWQKSSELGSPSAFYNLGVAHLGGNGTVKNLEKAKTAFTAAAQQGVTDAHLALGILGLHEAQSEDDFKHAGEHFRRAAMAGSSVASHNLSILYEKGLGYSKDAEKAQYWRDFLPSDKSATRPSSANNDTKVHRPDKHTVHNSDWIVMRPAENYTLQIASGDTLQGTQKLISKVTTLDCAIFTKVFAEKERFVAIAGDFLSYADALSAIEELPASLAQNKPFIVNFKLLQRQIADHTKFNN